MNYSFMVDLSKNRLYVTIKGTLMLSDAETYRCEFDKGFNKLKPGSTIVFDMREATAVQPEAAERLREHEVECLRKGLHKFAFIINSAILKGQMKRNYSCDLNKVDGYFDNIEDAIKFVDS